MILILFLQGTSPCSPLVSATFLYPPSRFAVIIPHLGISLLKTVATGTGKVKEATLFSSPVGHRYLFTAPSPPCSPMSPCYLFTAATTTTTQRLSNMVWRKGRPIHPPPPCSPMSPRPSASSFHD